MTLHPRHRGIHAIFFVCACLFATIQANTEKVIFVAPPLAKSLPQFDDLYIDTLSPTPPGHSATTLGTLLPVAFPSTEGPEGLDTWILLRGLRSGQRYEARVCWAAIQPTEFTIKAHEISHVANHRKLHQRLLDFSKSHQFTGTPLAIAPNGESESLVLLQIQAAADFFTSNDTLMRNPPPVSVDIILDPYLFGVFPQSLVGTAIYIIILAVGGFCVSGWIWERLQPTPVSKDHKD